MQIFLLQAAHQVESRLQNYYGGDNPIVMYGGILFALLTISAIIGYLLWMRWRNLQFDSRCSSWDLDPEEIGYLRQYIKRFHIRDPLTVIETGKAFEAFTNRLAHQFEYEIASEEELLRQLHYFQVIRSKIPLKHMVSKTRSSRTIQNGAPLTITFDDPSTGNNFSFDTHIVSNNDFFLGVTPPESKEIRAACDFNKPMLHIKFSEEFTEFEFDTRLARTVNQPDLMWLIRHNSNLTSHPISQEVDLTGSILAVQEGVEEPVEWEISIDRLGVEDCRVHIEPESQPLPIDSLLMIDLELAETPYTLRGQLLKQEDTHCYAIRFTGLTNEDKLQILRELNKNKTRSSAKGSF